MQLDDIIIFLIIAGSIITSIVRQVGEQQKKQKRPPTQTGQTAKPAAPTPAERDWTKRLEEARKRVQQAMEQQTTSSQSQTLNPGPQTPPPLIGGGLEGKSLEGGSLEGGRLTGHSAESSKGLLGQGGTSTKREVLRPEVLKPEPRPRLNLETDKDVFAPLRPETRNPQEFQQSVVRGQAFMGETAHRGQTSLKAAPPLQRKTTDGQKHAKIAPSSLLSPELLTEKELLRGLLWKQILSEPRSKTMRKYHPIQKVD